MLSFKAVYVFDYLLILFTKPILCVFLSVLRALCGEKNNHKGH